jgi:hypothetical protein
MSECLQVESQVPCSNTIVNVDYFRQDSVNTHAYRYFEITSCDSI